MVVPTARLTQDAWSDYLQVLQKLNALHDPAAARRVLQEARTAWPGEDDGTWWKWLAEAMATGGPQVRIVDANPVEICQAVRDGAKAVTRTAAGEWLVLLDARGWRVRVGRSPLAAGHERWLSRRELLDALGQHDEETPCRWLLLDPVELRVEPQTDGDGHGEHALSPFARLKRLLRPEWPDIAVVLVFAGFSGLLTLATPIAVEALVNTVAFGRFLQPLVILALILFTFLSFGAAIRALQTYTVEIIQRRLFARVAVELSRRLPSVRQDALHGAYGPELVNRFFDVLTVQKTCAQFLLDGVAIVMGTVIGMAVLAFYHPWLLGFDVVLLGLIGLTVFVLGRGAVKTAVKESKYKYAMAAWLQDLARCSTTFKLGGEWALARTDQLTMEYLQARRTHFRIVMRQVLFALGIQALASTVLLGLGGWLVMKGQLTLGQLVASELIVAVIVGSFAKLGKHMEAYYDLLAAVDKLGVLFDLPLERQEGMRHLAHDGQASAGTELVRLHVLTSESAQATFRDLDLQVPRGARLGLVGSAANQQALLDLIFGLRRPASGRVELAGSDLRDVRPDILRRHVALAREIECVSGTINENVSLHRPEVAMADVRLALRAVGLYDELMHLPEGLETPLTPSGSPLHRSQLIRLMLARAIAGRPQLLLLDGLLDGLPDGLLPIVWRGMHEFEERSTWIVASERQAVLKHCERVANVG